MSNQIIDTIFQDCPIRNVLAHICGKWSLLVIYVMRQNDSIRFNALNRAIPDISQKVLTSTLRSLEKEVSSPDKSMQKFHREWSIRLLIVPAHSFLW